MTAQPVNAAYPDIDVHASTYWRILLENGGRPGCWMLLPDLCWWWHFTSVARFWGSSSWHSAHAKRSYLKGVVKEKKPSTNHQHVKEITEPARQLATWSVEWYLGRDLRSRPADRADTTSSPNPSDNSDMNKGAPAGTGVMSNDSVTRSPSNNIYIYIPPGVPPPAVIS